MQLWQVRYGDDVDNTFVVVHPGDEEAVKRHFVQNMVDVGYLGQTEYTVLRATSEDLTQFVHAKRLDVVTTGPQMRMARVFAAKHLK